LGGIIVKAKKQTALAMPLSAAGTIVVIFGGYILMPIHNSLYAPLP
jgi:hypothetical protein